jgi:hypothetical protein
MPAVEKVNVKMRTKLCGPGLQAEPGETIEVSAEIGKQLVDGGFAERVDSPKPAPQAAKADDSKKRDTATNEKQEAAKADNAERR